MNHRYARLANTTFVATLLALTLACGYNAKATAPVAGTVPAISQLNPDFANAGGGDFTLTVNGSNFGSKAVVNWNGVAQTSNTVVVSGSQLTVVIPAAMIAASGMAQVTVTNPGTSGGVYGGGTMPETSMPMSFTIN